MAKVYTRLTKSNIKAQLNMGSLIKMTPKFWQKVGRYAISLIRFDLDRNILQGALRKDTYRSQQYKKYKSNEMRRVTVGKKNTKKSNLRLTTQGTLVKSNRRLKSYYGKKITSTETSSVNMTLTGELMNGLHVIGNHDSCVISALSRDAGKIIGNRRLGREILTLRDKNKRFIEQYITKNLFDKNLKNWARQNITIKIGA